MLQQTRLVHKISCSLLCKSCSNLVFVFFSTSPIASQANLALAMNFLQVILCCLAIFRPKLVKGGCCNENLWCDGDPSFREQPIISQYQNSTQVNITWSEAYVHLVKCVDYFFVQYAPTDANRKLAGL